MKRNFLSMVVMVISLLVLSNFSWGQCPEEPDDLGLCDTLHVVPWPETDTCFDGECINEPGKNFPCFVHVSLFVTHDSNTFWWPEGPGGGIWVEDSISAFVVPLTFWHPPGGCVDSVILPDYMYGGWQNWNNTECNPYLPEMSRSIFRDIVDTVTNDTTFNRMLDLARIHSSLVWSNRILDIETHSSEGDSGHARLSMLPGTPNNRRWWEGDRVLLATYTFMVYKSDACDTAQICLDSTFWPPTAHLTFTRQDAVVYSPRHNLPLCMWAGPPILVTSPNGGESWGVGETHDITWLSENFDGADVKLEFSADGGANWMSIEDITSNDGVYPWVIPDTMSDSCRVRVSDSDDGVPYDISDGDFSIGAANQPPVVSDIPDTSISEGESFAPITLDDYVDDPNNPDDEMTWTHWGEDSLVVDITNRIATITAPHPDWNGSETIWFKACDPGGMCDSNEATFTVTAVNDTPVVSDIPDTSISESESFAPINLDDYVTDPEDHDSVMIWTHSGEIELLVDITDRVATITVPHQDWNGSETIWFKACDPGGACDSNEATFTVTAVNDTPEVSDIPDTTIEEGESFASISLDDYVTDPDDHDSVMIWTHWGESELLVDITDRVATITVPNPDWNGSETIWFKACDPGGLCDSNEAVFTVTAINDTPVVSDIPDQTILQGESFASINLDDYVTDPEDHDSVMIWTHSGEVELLVDITDRVATITVPNPGWSGFETIWFKACDPGGLCDSNEATFTVLVSDFSIDVIPDTLKAARGYSGEYKVKLTSINDFVSNCTLTVAGHPDGSTATFDPAVLVPTDSSILTIAIPDTTPTDTFALTITASEMDKGKGIVHSDSVTLIVILPSWLFKVEAFPDTQIVMQGNPTTYEVTIIPTDSFTAPCSLFVIEDSLPIGATADFDSNPIPPNDTSTLTITTLVTTPPDTCILPIVAIANFKQRDTTHVTLIIQEMTDVEGEGDQPNVPDKFALFQNQPNPFNPETKISYYLSQGCEVKLTIYNILGRRIKTLFEGYQNTGVRTLVWDGRDDQGKQLGSGIYFYRLQAGEFTETRKMTLIK